METIPPKQQDMIDVTDSLEAVDAARGMRFFLFWFVLFPALLILQIIFWLNWAGRIEAKNACAESSVAWIEYLLEAGPVSLAAEIPSSEQSASSDQSQPAPQEPAKTPEAKASDVETVIPRQDIEKGVSEVTGSTLVPAEAEPAKDKQPSAASKFWAEAKLSYSFAKGIVLVCNFVILFAALLYCLILLLCLKISLVGRLGGLFHITKAFLISLLFLLILIPWQTLLPRVMVGVLWQPYELLGGRWDCIQNSVFWKTLYFIRFEGMWLLAFVLLFWSRRRFVKWRSATLRRLGVLR
jgi:hypothetical protein